MRPEDSQELVEKRKKWWKYHGLALSYNLGTGATYGVSFNGFPSHLIPEKIDRPMSSMQPWELAIPFSVCCLGELILSFTNQRQMPGKIAKMRGDADIDFKLPGSETWVKYETHGGAMFKSLVSTTSFWALLRDFAHLIAGSDSQKDVNWWIIGATGLVALVFGWPNYISQIVNFGEESVKFDLGNATIRAILGAGGYAICNGALYFNTFNKVWQWLVGGNLSELDSLGKQILFWINVVWSTQFTYETYQSYYQLIYNKLRSDSVRAPSSPNGTPLPEKWRLSLSGHAAAIWKTIVNSLALFTIGTDLVDGEIGFVFSLILTLVCLPGSYLAQKYFFYRPEGAEFEGACHRFFKVCCPGVVAAVDGVAQAYEKCTEPFVSEFDNAGYTRVGDGESEAAATAATAEMQV